MTVYLELLFELTLLDVSEFFLDPGLERWGEGGHVRTGDIELKVRNPWWSKISGFFLLFFKHGKSKKSRNLVFSGIFKDLLRMGGFLKSSETILLIYLIYLILLIYLIGSESPFWDNSHKMIFQYSIYQETENKTCILQLEKFDKFMQM